MWFAVTGTILSLVGWSLFLCYANGRWDMNATGEDLSKMVLFAGFVSGIAGLIGWACTLAPILIFLLSALVPAVVVGVIALLIEAGKRLYQLGQDARRNRLENDE